MSITVSELRARLADRGWDLTELAGGPWIIYGFNGDAELCVMGKTRLEVWLSASDAGKALAPASPSADGKVSA
jgi:hypothetical protein